MTYPLVETEATKPLIRLLGWDYLREAKKGGWRVTIIRGQRNGSKVAKWRVESMGGGLMKDGSCTYVLGCFANETFANEARDALNEAHTLYCMIRGTPAEKEYFP
jgi:hypothetical protein